MTTPLLRVTGLTKLFPGLRALDGVSLEVGSGEIVAVVGQNGSGKSTLVKILAGVYQADEGTVEVRDRDGRMVSGSDATAALHFIHQDLGLVPMLSTVENLDLGHDHGWRRLLPARRREEERRAKELIVGFGASFDVRMPISALTAAERAIVAIARALEGWTQPANVLVLDEPTAALAAEEVTRLFEAVRRAAEAGAGVMFISHRLDEVMELADRVVALRDGRVVADVAAGQFDHEALVRMIAGRDIAPAALRRDARQGDSVLSARGLRGATVGHVDLDLRAGEILGVSGLLGSGREHLASLLFGAVRREGGQVSVAGRPLPNGSPRAAIARDVALVPADRRTDGVVLGMCVRENLTLPRLSTLRRAAGRLDGRAERQEAIAWIHKVGLRPPEPEHPVKLLSGGNQQKVVLAKWLRNEPRVLLLDDPTQGVDVEAKASIYALIVSAAEHGAGVLVSSSDTKELALLCDRVLVLRDGVVAAELDGCSLTEAQLVRESLGLSGDNLESLSVMAPEALHA